MVITLDELFEVTKIKIKLEKGLKGRQPQTTRIVSVILEQYLFIWENIEISSYEPIILEQIQQRCPDLNTDLMMPKTQSGA